MFDLTADVNLYYFIPPMLLLIFVPTIFAFIYALIFRRILPTRVFDFLLKTVIILGFYVWAVPMELGFFEYFRATL